MKPTLPILLFLLTSLCLNASAQKKAVDSATVDRTDRSPIRDVTAEWDWHQIPTDNLDHPGAVVIHLRPCPLGVDTTSSAHSYDYKVYISGTGIPEAATVTGGSCKPGAEVGTIEVTTRYGHSSGYAVGSASTGIQEVWNDAWTSDIPTNASSLAAPYVKLVAEREYRIYSSVYLRGRGGILDGSGALIVCSTRDRCIFLKNGHYHKLYNLTGTSTIDVDGVQVSSVTANKGTYLVTTASNHTFLLGDTVVCEYHSQRADQHWVSQVLTIPSPRSFTVTFKAATFAAGANTFGFCNILNTFIENNSDKLTLQDLSLQQVYPSLGRGSFSYGITDDNDQQFIIERAGNRSSSVIKNSENWPIGAFFFQRYDQGNAGIMYIHDTELTNVNCVDGAGNGLVITDSVCQGFPVFGVRYFGSYQPSTMQNVYEESTGGSRNPLYGGLAAQMGLLVQGGLAHRVSGTFPISGWTPTFAKGGGDAAQRNYFVIPHSSSQGYGPMWFIGTAQPVSSDLKIKLQWPSIALQDAYYHRSLDNVTWDILITKGNSSTLSAPYGADKFAIATNVSGVCGSNGMCSYTDAQAELTLYKVEKQQFTPSFWFWPANIAVNDSLVVADVVGWNPGAVATQGISKTAIVAHQCESVGPASSRSPIWIDCLNTSNALQATVLQQSWNGGATPVNSKGRFNLGPFGGTLPNDLLTLVDSDASKTLSIAGEHPANDPLDIALGIDHSGGMSLRAGSSVSSYINSIPNKDGSNFLERLDATHKVFNVPVVINDRIQQGSSGNIAGSCSMKANASCTFRLKVPFSGHAICIPAVQGQKAIAGACSITGSQVTINAVSANSEKWGAILIDTSE
jgi:hypothetical protein